MSYTTIYYFTAVGIIALLMIVLIVHEIGKRAGVKMERERLTTYTSGLVNDKQKLEDELIRMSREMVILERKVEEQNVSRGTSSYNQSFGDPEVKMWLDQQFLEGDHK